MKIRYTVLAHMNKEIEVDFPDWYTDEDIEQWGKETVEGAVDRSPDVVMAEVIEWRKC